MSIRKRVGIVLLLISLFACFYLHGEAQETIRVMTFHIRHAEGTDGTVSLDRIAAAIKKGNPDLIALQGVDRGTKRTKNADQARLLAAELKMNYVFAKTQNEDGGETGNAILSRFPIGPYKMLQLPRAGNSDRGILVAIVKLGKGKKGKEIRFISTVLGGGASGQTNQADKLSEYFFIDGEDIPAILGCHLYVTSQAKPVAELRKQWTDAFDAAPKSSEEENTKTAEAVKERKSYILFRSKDPFKATERQVWIDPLLPYPPVLSIVTL